MHIRFFFLPLFIASIATCCSQTADTAGVRATVTSFWDALGRLDAVKVKRLLSFPCTIIEIPGSGPLQDIPLQNRPPRVGFFATQKEFDAEWKRSAGDDNGNKKHSDFHDVQLNNFNISFSGPNVAQATYSLSRPDSTHSQIQLIALLMRNGTSAAWRLVTIALPK